ncbi:unnamed protein product, partial [Phaeothamnion confervicola]
RPDRQYPFFIGFPIKPYFDRTTLRTRVTPDVHIFEQEQGFFNVSTTIRMTVIKLQSTGGLWVHAPVAPTEECIRLVSELGPVEHIVLPVTAVEHKAFIGPFSRKFPEAKVWICPGQWSFPINLPLNFRVDGVLCEDRAPWQDEIDCKLFRPPLAGVGESNEAVFFHRSSKTLLVTDSLICVPREPPAIIPVADLLLAAAPDDAGAPATPVEDTPTARRRGWAKMALQILFLGPARPETFDLLAERLICSPVVRELVLSRVLPTVRTFVDDVTSGDWQFKQVIPAHFAAPVRAGPKEFRRAYAFAFAGAEKKGKMRKTGMAAAGSGGGGDGGMLRWFGGGGGGGVTVDDLAAVPEEDLATLRFIKALTDKAGLARS